MNWRDISISEDRYCNVTNTYSFCTILICAVIQEPFDSVRDDFLKPLEKEEKEDLEKCLRLFDLDSLLGTLYEFIETHVKHSPNEELHWP